MVHLQMKNEITKCYSGTLILWYSFRLALCVPCLQGNKTEIRKLQVVDIQLIRRFLERIFRGFLAKNLDGIIFFCTFAVA